MGAGHRGVRYPAVACGEGLATLLSARRRRRGGTVADAGGARPHYRDHGDVAGGLRHHGPAGPQRAGLLVRQETLSRHRRTRESLSLRRRTRVLPAEA